MVPPDIDQYARHIIQDLSDRYHIRTARAAPHITVQTPFRWSRDRMPDLTQSLAHFTQRQLCIPIVLDGFGAFGKKVIYIHVKQSHELMVFQSTLANYLANTFQIDDPKAKQQFFSPHMTIASRKLTPRKFQHAWHYLTQHSVAFQYVSDRLTLLIHDGSRWQIQQEFYFLTGESTVE